MDGPPPPYPIDNKPTEQQEPADKQAESQPLATEGKTTTVSKEERESGKPFLIWVTYYRDAPLEQIWNWLMPSDFGRKHREVKLKRVEGSGKWFLAHEDYGRWKNPESPETMLYCPGKGVLHLVFLS